MRSLFARMYFSSTSGRVALFSGFIGLCIPFVHFVGGPPPLPELKLVEGIVLQTEATDWPKGGQDVILTTATSAGKEQLRYFVNRGENVAQSLLQLSGKTVRAWVERTYETRIYQLDVGQSRVIDYEVRRKQLTGDPIVLLVYFSAVFSVFALISIKRYREERR